MTLYERRDVSFASRDIRLYLGSMERGRPVSVEGVLGL